MRARTRQLAGAELEDLRSDNEVNDLITEAYEQIGYHTDWRWRDASGSFSTVASTDEYSLPSEVELIQGVQVTGASGFDLPVPLREVTLRDLLTRIDRDDEDLPRYYARTADKIKLGPIPDKTYTVEVFGQAPLSGLSVDSDTPEFASRFHPAICYLAASTYLNEEGQEELAQARRLRAEEFIADMLRFYQVSMDSSPVVVGSGQHVGPSNPLGRIWPHRIY